MVIEYKQIGNATYTLKIDNRVKILIDPALKNESKDGKRKRIIPLKLNEEDLDNIDFVLITQIESDHLDEGGVDFLNSFSGYIIINHLYIKKIKQLGVNNSNIIALDWLETKSRNFGDIKIDVQGTAAYRGANRIISGMSGVTNAYGLKITTGGSSFKILITADTVFNKRFYRTQKNIGNIDLLIASAGEQLNHQHISSRPISGSVKEIITYAKRIKSKNTIINHNGDFSDQVKSDIELNQNTTYAKNGHKINIIIKKSDN
jgi:L-ascorbate metabolism protein UlaG (beta-lactamase superfamily)